jgi:DNA-binding NarL/FixJ family response regulator
LTNVLIVDDEKIVRELFSHYISTASDRYRLSGVIGDAANAEILCLNEQIDLILMDVCTAEGDSGLDAAAAIKKKHPRTKIIVVTSAPDCRFLEKARQAGVESFWYKEAGTAELLDVMDRTVAGESVYPDRAPCVQLGLCSSDELTPKELEVLRGVVRGDSIGEIAERMHVDYTTTKTHLRHLKEKTGCRSTAELAVLAARTKIVLPDY